MTFCTKCGHKNAADARFCEECGTSLGARPAVVSPPTSVINESPSATSPGVSTPVAALRSNSKLIKITAIAVISLLVFGVGLFLVLAPESPSNAGFAKAIDRSLASNSQAYKSRYCLRNFSYDKDPVRVNEQDENTRRWMSVLTKAALYGEPELVTNSNGFFNTNQLVYTKTDAGKKATQGGQLCIADGVTVSKVESFTTPEKIGKLQASRATVTLKLRNPMPWVLTAETNAIAPAIQAEFSDNIVLALKDGKWEVTDAREIQLAEAAQRKLSQKPEVHASSGTGLFASILNLFSGSAGNPIIGRWKSEAMGVSVVAFEFDSNTMVSSNQKVKVRYEVEDKRVTVYPEGAGAGLIFNVIDHDTLSVNMGFMDMKLTRTN